MFGVDLKGAPKMLDGKIEVPLACRQNTQVIPGVGHCAWIVGTKLESALKTFAGLIRLLLMQAGAAKPIENFGAVRVVLESLPEKYLRLFEITAFKENETEGEVISPEVVGVAYSSKRKPLGQTLRIVLRDASEISLEVFLQSWSLVKLDDVSRWVDEE